MARSGWFDFLSVSQLKKLQAYNDKLDDPVVRAKALGVRWWRPGDMVVDGQWEERPECTRARYEEKKR